MKRRKNDMENLNKSFLDSIDGKNLNFLIGAGASSSSLKTITNNDKNEKGEKNIPSIENLFNKYENDEIAAALLKFIFFSMSVKDGLITAYTERDNGATEALKNYIAFINNIINLLNHTGFERPKRANIFTTNYDTFFELAFDQIAHTYPLAYFNDGTRGFFTREISYENYFFNISHSGSMDTYRREIPSINLYKMHGSLSWNKKAIDKDGIIISSNTNPVLDCLTKVKDKDAESFYEKVYKEINKFFTNLKKLVSSNSSKEAPKKDDIVILSNTNPVLDCLTKAKDKDTESFYEKVYKEINKFFTNLKKLVSSNSSEETLDKVTEEDLLIHFECLLTKLKETESESEINPSTSLAETLSKDLLKFEEIYDELLIVNPTKKKFEETVFEEQYYQLFRAFEEELQKPNSVLIVFGFSFKDKHINDILKRCLTNPTLQVFVVPYNEDDEKKVKEKFTGYGNISFMKKEDESKNNIKYKHGDFDVLNGFLSGKNDI